MLDFSKHAHVLRCVGQAMQSQRIDVFELQIDSYGIRARCIDPNPPYTDLIELRFSLESIQTHVGGGRSRRVRTSSPLQRDDIPEILRVVGEYIDQKKGRLKRLNLCGLSDREGLEVEYETTAGDVRSETLGLQFIRKAAADMQKRRIQLFSMLEQGVSPSSPDKRFGRTAIRR